MNCNFFIYKHLFKIKFFIIWIFLILFIIPVKAGNCDLGPSAYNLISNARYSYTSPDTHEVRESFYNSVDHFVWLSISSAIDRADDWKMEKWNRNFIGQVSSETINSINNRSDALGLNSKIWHVSNFDEDIIISAKVNVIKAAEFAKFKGLGSQSIFLASSIKTATVENSQAAAYDILSHVLVYHFRKVRLKSYWEKIIFKLSNKFPGSWSSATISQIKEAFEQDHPINEDELDANALKNLMLMREPNGQTLYKKASTGNLDSNSIYQITGRKYLVSYFQASCQ